MKLLKSIFVRDVAACVYASVTPVDVPAGTSKGQQE